MVTPARANEHIRLQGTLPFPYNIPSNSRFGLTCVLLQERNRPKRLSALSEGLAMPISMTQKAVGDILRVRFGHFTIHENIRPSWFVTPAGERLELDFYIEELRVAFEVQGLQHYIFTPHFHASQQDFQAQLDRDKAKRALCDSLEIALYEVTDRADLLAVLNAMEFGDHLDRVLSHGEFGHDEMKIRYIRSQTTRLRKRLEDYRYQINVWLVRLGKIMEKKGVRPKWLMKRVVGVLKEYRELQGRLLRSTANTARYYDQWIAPQVDGGQPVYHKSNVKKTVRRVGLGPDLRSLKAHKWAAVGTHFHWLYLDDIADEQEVWQSECGSFKRHGADEVAPELVLRHTDRCCKNCLVAFNVRYSNG